MDLKQADIGLLIALDALLAHEAVTLAARQLRISQPAMSAQLARLRKLLDDPLLVASGRKLVPTARALDLKQPLRLLLNDLDALVREGAPFDAVSSDRTFRLVGTDYTQAVIVPALMDLLSEEAPEVRLAVLPFEPTAVWQQLEEDDADVVLAVEMDLPDARKRPGFEEDFVLILRKDHPLAEGPLSVERFCEMEHILISPEGGGFFGATDKVLAEQGLKRRVSCSLPGFLLAPALVAESELVAVVPRRLAKRNADRVAAVELPFRSPVFPVGMYWHPRRQNDPAHMWFRNKLGSLLSGV